MSERYTPPEVKKIWTPESVLIQLAKYCERHMAAPFEAVEDGTFAGNGKMTIDDKGNVVLVRYAKDKQHLTKSGLEATAEEMRTASEFSGGASNAGAIPTSADLNNTWSNTYPLKGVFKIPVEDFLELGRQGKVIIGNLGETEILIDGSTAERYLDHTEESEDFKKPDFGGNLPEPPDEIVI